MADSISHDPHAAAADGEVQTEGSGLAQADDINVTLVAQVGIVAAIALFVLICGLEAWFYIWSDQEAMEKIQPSQALITLRATQLDRLKGTAPDSLPIADAMDKIVERYAAKADH